VSGVLKNFIDIFARLFDDKQFGAIESLGSSLYYLAGHSFQQILSIECDATFIYPLVMMERGCIQNGEIQNGEIQDEKVLSKIDALLTHI